MEWHTVQRKVELYRTNSTLRCSRVHIPYLNYGMCTREQRKVDLYRTNQHVEPHNIV